MAVVGRGWHLSLQPSPLLMLLSRLLCNRASLFVAVSICFAVACVRGEAASLDPVPSGRGRVLFERELTLVATSLASLDTALRTSSHPDRAVSAFREARVVYKHAEPLLMYYAPLRAALISGPRPEGDDDAPNAPVRSAPTGFQVIEAALFDGSLTRDSARAEIVQMRAVLEEIRAITRANPVDRPSLIDAAKLQLARTTVLGLAGFDADPSGDGCHRGGRVDGRNSLVARRGRRLDGCSRHRGHTAARRRRASARATRLRVVRPIALHCHVRESDWRAADRHAAARRRSAERPTAAVACNCRRDLRHRGVRSIGIRAGARARADGADRGARPTPVLRRSPFGLRHAFMRYLPRAREDVHRWTGARHAVARRACGPSQHTVVDQRRVRTVAVRRGTHPLARDADRCRAREQSGDGAARSTTSRRRSPPMRRIAMRSPPRSPIALVRASAGSRYARCLPPICDRSPPSTRASTARAAATPPLSARTSVAASISSWAKAKCATCHFVPLFNGVVPPDYRSARRRK